MLGRRGGCHVEEGPDNVRLGDDTDEMSVIQDRQSADLSYMSRAPSRNLDGGAAHVRGQEVSLVVHASTGALMGVSMPDPASRAGSPPERPCG